MASLPHDPIDVDAATDARSRPPQFALRTLMIGVAMLAATLWLLINVGPIAIVILVPVALIVAHVAGNALGTHLRAQAPTRGQAAADTPRVEPAEAARADMPPSQLVDDVPLDRRVVSSILVTGVSAASIMTLLTIPIWARVGAAGIAIMVTSATVIGACFGFMGVRFVTALRGAFRPGPLMNRGRRRGKSDERGTMSDER
ncbi:MAG: hypothetical protein WD176_07980 [Pirellulales bacterium]